MSAQPARAYLGIGEVLARLRPEFPDVSVSKIRFLESEGLIEPARSPSGYRRFDAADVERLRYILTAQRDQYLPLRVIKERLPPPDAAATPPGSAPAPSGDAPAVVGQAALSRRELLTEAGISEKQLAELETFGLVRRVGRAYGRDALQVASAAAALGRHGVEARHLRVVRAAVEREISFMEQVVAPTLHQRNAEAREQAGRTAREIAALTMMLHGALIESALAEAGFPGDGLTLSQAGYGPAAGGPQAKDAAEETAGRRGYPADRSGVLRQDRTFGGASA